MQPGSIPAIGRHKSSQLAIAMVEYDPVKYWIYYITDSSCKNQRDTRYKAKFVLLLHELIQVVPDKANRNDTEYR